MRDVAVEAMCDGCDGAGVPLLPDEVDVARSVWGWVFPVGKRSVVLKRCWFIALAFSRPYFIAELGTN